MKRLILLIIGIILLCNIIYADTYSAGTEFTPTQSNVTYNLTRILLCDHIDIGKWCFNITGGNDLHNYCNISNIPIIIHILAGPVITSYQPLTNPSIIEPNNQIFNITVSDVDENNLIYLWKQNGNEVAITQNFTFIGNDSSAGVWNISILVSDGNGTDYHEWQLIVNTINDTNKLREQVKAGSLILNSVMAILMLAAVLIPAGLIIVMVQGEFDISLTLATIISIIGLGVIILMFWLIKSALINAI